MNTVWNQAAFRQFTYKAEKPRTMAGPTAPAPAEVCDKISCKRCGYVQCACRRAPTTKKSPPTPEQAARLRDDERWFFVTERAIAPQKMCFPTSLAQELALAKKAMEKVATADPEYMRTRSLLKMRRTLGYVSQETYKSLLADQMEK